MPPLGLPIKGIAKYVKIRAKDPEQPNEIT